jgi:uncharacterized repeat protein (TIGR01451 family)
VEPQTWASLQSAVQQAKLLPRPNGIGGQNSQFGYSVSVDGSRALVGGINLLGPGAALVLIDNGSGWQEQAVLLPADGESGDQFGVSVSLSGDRALVGASGDDDNGSNSGSAYVFDFDGSAWSETAKLKPADGAGSDRFGVSVSLSGDRALVGARFDDDNGSSSGSAYVFDFDGTSWGETAKLKPADGAASDYFGDSVSLSGDRALVGADGDDDNGSSSGSAYVFDFDGTNWNESAKFKPADGAARDRFGESVSLSGDRALVGARFDDDNGNDSGSAYVFDFNGTSWGETAKLKPNDSAASDLFGYSVSLSGDRALVGAYRDDDNGIDSGAAYVFDFDGTNWVETAKLEPTDGEASDFFGRSVSLSGDRALVGAPRDDDNDSDSGSAYVFGFDGTSWSEMAKLKPTDGAAIDYFGISVSLSGNRALVGAYFDDDNGSNAGSAYVFDFDGTNWSETAKLTPADGAASDYFGESVSLSGGRALVGARLDDDNGNTSGSAYVFDFDGTSWSETAKLTSADGAASDWFGESVSLSGDRALVGAYRDNDNGSSSGSAYVFDFDGTSWGETAKLKPTDGAEGDQFGESVSLSGDRALVGADGDDDNGSNSGSAYVFDFDGTSWSETTKLKPADGAASDFFGYSVSLSGDRALVGARYDDDNGNNSGSAYVFDFNGTSWNETAKLKPADGAAEDRFALTVSLSDDRALIGAPYDDDSGNFSGSAYMFEFNGTGWSEMAKLTPADGAASDSFGRAVSLSGDRALVGAYGDDDHGVNSGSAYVFINNQAPIAKPDGVTADEDTALNGNVLSDNGNGIDEDPDGDPLTVTEVDGVAANVGSQITLTSGALLTVDVSGTFAYDPNDQFETLAVGDTATDAFDYTISDGIASDSATVTITINGANDAPLANVDARTTGEASVLVASDADGTGTGGDSSDDGVLVNDTDIDGDVLTVDQVEDSTGNVGTAVSLPSGATVTVAADGTFVYDPNGQFIGLDVGEQGSDAFTYRATDGNATATAEVNITIDGVNDPPAAAADAFTTDEDVQLAGNVYADNGSGPDSDPDDPLSVMNPGTLTATGLGGSVDLQANGDFTYTPPADASGTDTFDYTLEDDNGATSTATVTITVEPVDDPPTAVGDTASLDEDAAATVIDVLANDTDVDGGPIAIDAVTQPAAGTVVVTGGGSGLTYEPTPDACNDGTPTDEFSYTLAPGGTSATVAVSVACINDAPTFVAGSDVETLEDTAYSQTWATDVSAGPEESNQSLAFEVTTDDASLFDQQPAIDANGLLTFTPAPDATGTATATVVLSDDGGTANGGSDESAPATFDIAVNAGADIQVDKTVEVTTLQTGALLTYIVTVSNAGPSDVSGIVVEDNPPAVLNGVSWSCMAAGSASCSETSGSGAVSLTADIPEGDSVTVELTGTIPEITSDEISNTAIATLPAGFVEVDSTNNADTAAIAIRIFSDRFEN